MFAIFLGSYIASSFVLFKYPQIIYKKKKILFKCRNICHRGGSFENVENTIEAFKRAVKIGADMLELDCHLTLDGKVVVVHDDDLNRLTGVPIRVANTNYNDLPPLLPNKNLLERDQNFAIAISNHTYHIPLLEDIFKEFPKTPINIDIKVYNKDLISKVALLIKEYAREHITVWGSFQDIIEKECWKIDEDIPLYFSLKRVSILVILYYTGLLPFVPLKESFLEIPIPGAVLRTSRIEPLPKSKKFLYFLADKFLLKRSFIKHLEKRGIQTLVWTLNDESDFEFAFKKLEVAGVMTDSPTKLHHYLKKLE